MNLKNNKGFSLIEVLVAIALVGGLSLMIAKLMQDSNKVIKTTTVGLDAIAFESLLVDIFKNMNACTNTFGRVLDLTATPVTTLREGITASSDNILETNTFSGKKGIFNADRDVLWSKDDIVTTGLKLKSITIPSQVRKLNGVMSPNYTVISTSPPTGFYEVHVELEKTGSATQTYGTKSKKLVMNITAMTYGADNRISVCQLAGQPAMASGSSLSGKFLCSCSSYNTASGTLSNTTGCTSMSSMPSFGNAIVFCDIDKSGQTCWPYGGLPQWTCSQVP